MGKIQPVSVVDGTIDASVATESSLFMLDIYSNAGVYTEVPFIRIVKRDGGSVTFEDIDTAGSPYTVQGTPIPAGSNQYTLQTVISDISSTSFTFDADNVTAWAIRERGAGGVSTINLNAQGAINLDTDEVITSSSNGLSILNDTIVIDTTATDAAVRLVYTEIII
jgi:hypothetical protein